MDKEFEAKVKGMYSGGGCACQTGVLELKKNIPQRIGMQKLWQNIQNR